MWVLSVMNSPEGTQSLNALCSELIEDVTEILFSLYLSAIGAYILKFRFTVFITSLSSFYKKIANGYFRQLFLKFHVYLK